MRRLLVKKMNLWYNTGMELPVFIILAILIFATLAIAFWTYRVAFYSPLARKEDIYEIPEGEQYEKGKSGMIALIDEIQTVPFEWVEITAKDGLILRGRYYHVRDEAPLQIQFHGYRGTAYRDFCGGNKLARECGHNTLLIDQRAHGKSGGKTITFGVKEREDCLAWLEYANRRWGEHTQIWLSGVSMGAATVLMATEFSLPKNVRGVIADSPFSSPDKIVSKVCKEMGYPSVLAMPFVRLGARLFGGFSLRSATAERAVRNASVPILIIHGEDDRFVPCDMSREIYLANPEKITLVTFPHAGHGVSYIEDPKGYERTIRAFIDKHSQ